MSQLSKLIAELKSKGDKKYAANSQRFFKTGPGQYGEGDVFLGLRVPLQRQIASKYRDLTLNEIETLLSSEIHEFRLVGLFILTDKYRKAEDFKKREDIVKFYFRNAKRINNWDLVDLSAYKILGCFLVEQEKIGNKKWVENALEKLMNSKNIWERRIAAISTFAFLRRGNTAHTFEIARRLLSDKHDLIHKAVGWMLREAGKRDNKKLLSFLDSYKQIMPRTALRYAIERLSAEERKHYLAK